MVLLGCALNSTSPAKVVLSRRLRPTFGRPSSCFSSVHQRKRSETGSLRNHTSLLWRLALPRLPRFSGEEVCRILERHGFLRVRQRGSHVIMQRRNEDSTITVPVPNHRELKIGTLRSIIRQSQLPLSAFVAE
jgi:predicted RNA binding protein YcfA (HicA-like mRNA interferase family)